MNKQQKQLIPLSSIENRNLKNMIRIETIIYRRKLRKEIDFQLSVDGECPTYLSAIDYDFIKQTIAHPDLAESVENQLNIRVGDFIYQLNGKNVSRASKKTVQKMIKSSEILVLTLYRQPNFRPEAVTAAPDRMISKRRNKNRAGGLKMSIKPFFSRLVSCAASKSSTSDLTCNYYNNTKRHHQQQKSFVFENATTLTDRGYCSIEAVKCANNGTSTLFMDKSNRNNITNKKKSTSLNTIASYSSGFKSLTEMETSEIDDHDHHDDDVTTTASMRTSRISSKDEKFVAYVNEMIERLELNIDMFVRPMLTFKILNRVQYLNLYQNIEKLIPVTKFFLNVLESNSLSADSFKIIFDSYKTYLHGLPNAIGLLSQLTNSHERFISFVEKKSCALTHLIQQHQKQQQQQQDSFELFDFLFAPFEFLHKLIEYLQFKLMSINEDEEEEEEEEEDDNQGQQQQTRSIRMDDEDAKRILNGLIKCSMTTSRNLNEILEKTSKNVGCCSVIVADQTTPFLLDSANQSFESIESASSSSTSENSSKEEATTMADPKSFYSSSLSFTVTTIDTSAISS